MKKIWTYVPLVAFLIVLFAMKKNLFTTILLIGFAILMVIAKYQRQKNSQEKVEYDDRVNQNITKWSLRSLYLFNSLFVLILFLQQQGITTLHLQIEWLIFSLILSLFIPFYLIPTIMRYF